MPLSVIPPSAVDAICHDFRLPFFDRVPRTSTFTSGVATATVP